MGRFGQTLTAMITPFSDDGSLDLGGAAELARWLVAHGNDGLIIAGTTGEAPTLTHDEQADLIAAVVDSVDVPVVAGTGSNDTRSAIDNTERATKAGADAVLLVSPYYNRPSQAGLDAHFRAVAASTELPVMLYDIPGRTGRKISSETILSLAESVDNIVALKDASGNPAETAAVIAAAPEGFEVYSGDDALTLPLLAVGAVGAVGVATHWIGLEHAEMLDAFATGDIERARTTNQSMLASFAYETGDSAPNPVPTKALLRVLGLPAGECRPPMGPTPPGLEDEARRVLAGTAVGTEYGF